MFEKEKYACWFGLFAGLLMDTVSPSMVGYNALIMLILCTLIGFISTNYLRNTLLTNIIVSLLFIFLTESLYWLFFVEFKQTVGAPVAYLTVFLPTILLSSIMSVPVFFIVRAINKRLKAED
jgi:rod shape-determining protein MreD